MNRTELQALTSERIDDARALLQSQRWSGAYYLAGYAVECSLKSCILARNDFGIIFDDTKFAQECRSHDLDKLIRQAALAVDLQLAASNDAIFEQNWLIAKDWSEKSRYRVWTQAEAAKLFNAINDNSHGELRWVQGFW